MDYYFGRDRNTERSHAPSTATAKGDRPDLEWRPDPEVYFCADAAHGANGCGFLGLREQFVSGSYGLTCQCGNHEAVMPVTHRNLHRLTDKFRFQAMHLLAGERES